MRESLFAMIADAEACWNAIARRDRHADGSFVYAVRTTGVFCRPSCAARTPRREHVTFFDAPAAAVAAGFRACRRCRPDHPDGSRAEEIVAATRTHLDEAGEAVPLERLAAETGVSASYLRRVFTRLTGLTPRAYADARRVERTKAALRDGETALGAAFEAGFGSARALYERAPTALGMTPGTYRRGGAGETIRYALFDTALGAVLVAATEKGVCAVTLGDAPEPLEADLRREFPRADLYHDDAAVGPWAEPVLRYLAGAPGDEALHAVPLDLRGTSFQRQVWAALRSIPFGQTRTYGEVAALLGRASATRAVAQACGANRVALVVPCHRVVGAGGELRGYRWGPERKAALLRSEASASPPEQSERTPGECC